MANHIRQEPVALQEIGFVPPAVGWRDTTGPAGEATPSAAADETALPGDPTTVVFFDMGSEVQIFDPKTLSRRKN